jgi:DNA-binding SARP family transcriptional activator
VEFRILGPVEALEDGRALPIGGPRQRALLALLLLNAKEVVSSERLIDELWSAEQPKDPQTALQNQVSRLRKALDGRIVSRSHGYLIRVQPGELDLERFRTLIAESEEAEAKERSQKLRQALALWHGRPLANVVHEPFADLEAARLEEMRLAALEDRIDADLELGRHSDLVGELHALVGEHALRERLRGQLMLALYRSGRQAEALEAFREGRRLLVDELGLEPSVELKDLEAAILRHDAGLIVPRARRVVRSAGQARRRSWRRGAVAATLAALALLVPTLVLALMDDEESPKLAPAADTTPADAPKPAERLARTKTVGRRAPPERIGRTSVSAPRAVTRPNAAALARAGSRPREGPRSRATTSPRGRAISAPPPVSPSQSSAATRQKANTSARGNTPAKPTSTRKADSAATPRKAHSAVESERPAAATTTVRTTTTPSKPPRTPATPPAAAGSPRRITDDFSDSQIDPQTWHLLITGTEVDAAERNGRFEVTIGPNAVAGGAYNVIDAHLGTQCRFPGDFDARVDYHLARWPPANGVNVGLAAFFADARVVRESKSAGDFYESWIPPRFIQASRAAGTHGALRLARENGTVATYYQAGDGWVKLDSAPATGTAVIGPSAMSSNDRFGHTQVEVAFDNFVVEGNAADCPG